jgi:hypothetical protein
MADPPITGVAAGGLGTAANIDDTQVMRTADLQAAAASPDWLDDDAPAVAPDPEPIPADELALLHGQLGSPDAPAQALQAEPVVAPPPRAKPRRDRTAVAASGTPIWRRRSAPAVAGVAALAILLLIAGSGFLSQLDLGVGAGSEPAASTNALIEAAPSPSAEPKEAKAGHGKCHGRGHGNNCQGGED